ncbi:helix-turn-helix domain-containing protein [Nocardioides humi]|uniref:HTH cro/C1-type domain-containing protein n=1 Tax=Nocardioides humi TaxID=449461 RepID=A0ABN2ARL2_9ACTN|nr:helix-turn-helix transcriptional regulator [Nocardioides humi]
MRGIIASFERRVQVDEAVQELWYRVSAGLDVRDGSRAVIGRSVLANALALIHFPEVGDVDDLARLVQEHGGRQVAQTQEDVLAPVDDPERTLTTRLVRVLGGYAWGGGARPGTPLAPDGRADLQQVAGEAVARLLLVGAADPEPPAVDGEQALLAVFRDGHVPVWRALVGGIAADPWNGTTDRSLGLLDPAERPLEIASIRAVADVCRRDAEEAERQAVAAHIRSVIEQAGLTQRGFAALVGTSPSRLSTYATGAVTPSAAMLLRINRVARRLRERRDADGSPPDVL